MIQIWHGCKQYCSLWCIRFIFTLRGLQVRVLLPSLPTAQHSIHTHRSQAHLHTVHVTPRNNSAPRKAPRAWNHWQEAWLPLARFLWRGTANCGDFLLIAPPPPPPHPTHHPSPSLQPKAFLYRSRWRAPYGRRRPLLLLLLLILRERREEVKRWARQR